MGKFTKHGSNFHNIDQIYKMLVKYRNIGQNYRSNFKECMTLFGNHVISYNALRKYQLATVKYASFLEMDGSKGAKKKMELLYHTPIAIAFCIAKLEAHKKDEVSRKSFLQKPLHAGMKVTIKGQKQGRDYSTKED